jgi:hypothetical protein
MLWGNWMPENWGMLAFLQKTQERDATNTSSDGDLDHYYLDISYKADMGKTTAAILAGRNATPRSLHWNPDIGDGGDYEVGQVGSGGDYTTAKFWLTGKYAWDALHLEYEVDYNFGDCNTRDCTQKNLGLYADLGYNAGDFTFGAKGMYASGDDDWFDSDDESWMGAAGLGRDFNPQQIMTGDYLLILNGDNPLAVNSIRFDVQQAGMWGVVGYVGYNVSPKLTLRADIGTYSSLEELSGYDDSYGQEYGVGLEYKLYDNLVYAAHFSYMKTGDFFESSADVVKKGAEDDNPNHWGDTHGEARRNHIHKSHDGSTEDIYLVAHALSMKF